MESTGDSLNIGSEAPMDNEIEKTPLKESRPKPRVRDAICVIALGIGLAFGGHALNDVRNGRNVESYRERDPAAWNGFIAALRFERFAQAFQGETIREHGAIEVVDGTLTTSWQDVAVPHKDILAVFRHWIESPELRSIRDAFPDGSVTRQKLDEAISILDEPGSDPKAAIENAGRIVAEAYRDSNAKSWFTSFKRPVGYRVADYRLADEGDRLFDAAVDDAIDKFCKIVHPTKNQPRLVVGTKLTNSERDSLVMSIRDGCKHSRAASVLLYTACPDVSIFKPSPRHEAAWKKFESCQDSLLVSNSDLIKWLEAEQNPEKYADAISTLKSYQDNMSYRLDSLRKLRGDTGASRKA